MLSVAGRAPITLRRDPATATSERAVSGACATTRNASCVEYPTIVCSSRGATTHDRVFPPVLATDRGPLRAWHVLIGDESAEREICRPGRSHLPTTWTGRQSHAHP